MAPRQGWQSRLLNCDSSGLTILYQNLEKCISQRSNLFCNTKTSTFPLMRTVHLAPHSLQQLFNSQPLSASLIRLTHTETQPPRNLPLKDFIGNMEVLSVSKPAGIVKKSSQSDVISGGLVPPWCAIKGSTRRSEAAVLSSDGTSWMFDEHFWWIKTFQEKKLPVNDDRCYYVPAFFVSFLLVCFMVLSKCFA